MSSTTGGRVSTVSSDSRGPLLNIASWICMAAMSIVVATKLTSKVFKVRQLQSDDYLIASSMLVAIVTSGLSNVQTAAGLGRHMSDVHEDENVRLQKAIYAAQILYVASLYLARLGVLRFLLLLAANNRNRQIINSGALFAIISCLAMELVLVFQCSPPRTWALFSDNCIDEVKFWTAEVTLGAVLDVFLACLPAYLLYDIHLQPTTKIYVASTFLVRLLVIPLTILRLLSIHDLSTSNDPSYDAFMPTLYTIIHMDISIIVTCIPFLKPFTDNLQTGVLAGDLHTYASEGRQYGAYAGRITLRKLDKDVSSASGGSKVKGRWMAGSVLDATRSTKIESTSRKRTVEGSSSRGTSQEGLVIRQTVTVDVETQSRGEPSGSQRTGRSS